MANLEIKTQKHAFWRCFVVVFYWFSFVGCATNISTDSWCSTPQSNYGSSPPLDLHEFRNYVKMDNGIVKLTLTKPTGMITRIAYNGISNLLDFRNKETQRGYWDIMWSISEESGSFFDTLQGTSFRVIAETRDQIEVSFSKTWNFSLGPNAVPLNIDKRFMMLRGVSGFYSYAIFEHLERWPDLDIDEARITFKLNQKKFHYMAISDDRQRIMPTEHDRTAGQILGYREAVLLTNPTNPKLKGEVDDKYQYSSDNKDNHVHGWISSHPHTGFWVITPSDELRAGGPMKTDLTSHAGPTSLSIFFSDHYAGTAFGVKLRNGEPWKKVFGPVFLYLNSDSGGKPSPLWEDAKMQMWKETKKWPYDFPVSKDFPSANQRGTVCGRLLVRDRYIDGGLMPAKSAYVGLASPGDAGSWQDDAKGYQFWTRTDQMGFFEITAVRAGTYNLYAWVPGIIGDYKHNYDVIIQPGSLMQIGNLVYNPPRNGPTLWEIGIPDRTASEFYVPDPRSGLTNKLYLNHTEKFRQYGLWDRYTDLYPTKDLVYRVGVSNYWKDWFFAHVNRRTGRSDYIPTTWQISFHLRNVIRTGSYTLRLALASASFAEMQVWINNPYAWWPHFTTRLIGRDNAIARHGIHGRYWLFSVKISGFQLMNGKNRIYIKQARGSSPFTGVMYDYIRLEGPSEEGFRSQVDELNRSQACT